MAFLVIAGAGLLLGAVGQFAPSRRLMLSALGGILVVVLAVVVAFVAIQPPRMGGGISDSAANGFAFTWDLSDWVGLVATVLVIAGLFKGVTVPVLFDKVTALVKAARGS